MATRKENILSSVLLANTLTGSVLGRGFLVVFFFFATDWKKKMLVLLQSAILAVRQRSPLKGGGNFNCATYCGHTVPGYSSRMLLVMSALQAASLSSLTSWACRLLSKNYVLVTKMDFKKQSITLNKRLHKYPHLLTKGKNFQVTYHDIYLYWTTTAVSIQVVQLLPPHLH